MHPSHLRRHLVRRLQLHTPFDLIETEKQTRPLSINVPDDLYATEAVQLLGLIANGTTDLGWGPYAARLSRPGTSASSVPYHLE